MDGSSHTIQHLLALRNGGSSKKIFLQVGTQRSASPRPLPLPSDRTFGVEFELTLTEGLSGGLQELARRINESRGVSCRAVGYTHKPTDFWKLVPDSSVKCSAGHPNCLPFELVSPILRGAQGLDQVQQVLLMLEQLPVNVAVNKSAGFHLHVDVGDLAYEQLQNVCLNFIKYEECFDCILPASRRGNANKYCQSNRKCSNLVQLPNRQAALAMQSASNLHDLSRLLNPPDVPGDLCSRYFKLDLQPIALGRQKTVEFRQHSATFNYQKASAWIQMIMLFVSNSSRLQRPSNFMENHSIEHKFSKMFRVGDQGSVSQGFLPEA